MIISEELLNKIKKEADIVKIIGEYIKLEKKGANFVGLCPFHPDTNPSLSVSPAKNIYKCFSCGASGNIFTFVQDYEHIPFPKAVQVVASKCGINIDNDLSENDGQNFTKYYDIMQKATSFYEFYLKNTNDGKSALNYLHDRHLDDDIIKRFRIGLAPVAVDLLYRSLLNEKIQPLNMIEVGLVRSNKEYYDVFRNRIMFPIEDLLGNLVGFSGRIFQKTDSKEAKYLNSNENVIFKKGQLLYNYKNAINEIKNANRIIVFEGFMDVIAAYRASVFHTVATMGTALTQQQIKAISKLTNNVTLCYDGDFAGIEATKKAIHLFNQAKFNVSVVKLPDELDPDEYINQFGAERLKQLLTKETITGIDYLYEVEKKNLIVADINSVETFKNIIFEYMHYYRSQVLNERYLKQMAKDLSVSVESLQGDFNNNQFKTVSNISNFNDQDVVDFQQKEKSQIRNKHQKMKFSIAERGLIRQVYWSKENCLRAKAVLGQIFVLPKQRDLLYSLYDYYQLYPEMNEQVFKSRITADMVDLLINILQDTKEPFIELNEIFDLITQYNSEKTTESVASSFIEDPSLEKLKQISQLKKGTIKFKGSDNNDK
ncbi:MAG: DNA primase [Bacilli bacterium]